jgi:hypothetical protein
MWSLDFAFCMCVKALIVLLTILTVSKIIINGMMQSSLHLQSQITQLSRVLAKKDSDNWVWSSDKIAVNERGTKFPRKVSEVPLYSPLVSYIKLGLNLVRLSVNVRVCLLHRSVLLKKKNILMKFHREFLFLQNQYSCFLSAPRFLKKLWAILSKLLFLGSIKVVVINFTTFWKKWTHYYK